MDQRIKRPYIPRQDAELEMEGKKINPFPNRRTRRLMAKQGKVIKKGFWKIYNDNVKAADDQKAEK